MTAEEGKSTRPSGLRYLVTQDGYVAGGIIDDRGVTVSESNRILDISFVAEDVVRGVAVIETAGHLLLLLVLLLLLLLLVLLHLVLLLLVLLLLVLLLLLLLLLMLLHLVLLLLVLLLLVLLLLLLLLVLLLLPIDPRLRSGSPLVLPEYSPGNGVSMLAFQDEFQSYRLALTKCKVTLHYKPGKFVGVYSHNYSSSYRYNLNDLCGDCDGTRNEVDAKLPPEMLGNVRSLKERDAAMLYMTSAHISGGPKYVQLVIFQKSN
ncbi:hypothetical protein PoB_005412100 [Plakobranchus ocellatus]|uniref:Uncharacterized protein n=1 Tax=Plakobranchus ocellatus TaxID=259542 RepID=A0AAV4C8F4_9GAST|nr:hypothetical protein PoB_005412100 [Plakobranchus ocellatus]